MRVAILTGAGNMFSAGADLKERVDLVHEPGDYVRHNRLVREFFYAVTDCAKPVIAAVNGPAIGAGFVLMLACDIMLASENAYFVHAGDQCRARRRRALPDGAFRPLDARAPCISPAAACRPPSSTGSA